MISPYDFLLLLFGQVLYKGPQNFFNSINEPHWSDHAIVEWIQLAGMFLLFCFWLKGSLSWGRVVAKFLRVGSMNHVPLFLALACGSAFLSLLTSLLGLWCTLFFTSSIVSLAILFLGLALDGQSKESTYSALAAIKIGLQRLGQLKSFWSLENLGLSSLILYLIFSFFLTLVPNPYYDPLNYHLAAPRLWYFHAKIDFLTQSIPGLHCSFFDYLYIWPNIILSHHHPRDPVYIQIFSQLIHFIIGYIGSALAIYEMIKILKFRHRDWIFLAILAVLMRASLQHKGMIAKNDWGIILWVLTGGNLLTHNADERASRRIFFAAYFLFGMSFAGKYTSVFSSAFIILANFTLLFKKQRKYFQLSLGLAVAAIVLASFPILLRNYIWTNNPVFPLLDDFFTQYFGSMGLGPTWSKGFKSYEGESILGNLTYLGIKIKKLIAYHPHNMIFFLPIFFFLPLSDKKLITHWWFLLLASFISFSLLTGELAETREIGALIAFFPGFNLLVLAKILEYYWQQRTVILKTLAALTFLYFYSTALRPPTQLNMIPENISVIWQTGRLSQFVETFSGGSLKKWLQNEILTQRLAVEQKIYIMDDLTLYYFLPLNVVKIFDQAELDRKLYKTTSAKEIFRLLKDQGGKYLLDSHWHFDTYYNPKMVAAMRKFIDEHPKVVVFRNFKERIIDLDFIDKN